MVRMWLAFAGVGCAGALAYRGDWAAFILAAAVVLLPAVWWVRGELAAGRAWLREHPELVAGRHRKRRSLRDAVMAALTAAARVPLP